MYSTCVVVSSTRVYAYTRTRHRREHSDSEHFHGLAVLRLYRTRVKRATTSLDGTRRHCLRSTITNTCTCANERVDFGLPNTNQTDNFTRRLFAYPGRYTTAYRIRRNRRPWWGPYISVGFKPFLGRKKKNCKIYRSVFSIRCLPAMLRNHI